MQKYLTEEDMEQLNFLLSDEPFKMGRFSTTPAYSSESEFVVLAKGITSDIAINTHTTSKDVRKGKYSRVIRISKCALSHQLTLKSPCRESTYQFLITITSDVRVTDPIKYYNSRLTTGSRNFIEGALLNQIQEITMNYSMFEYGDMRSELTRTFLTKVYEDKTEGLTFEIVSLKAQPDTDMANSIRERDNMYRSMEIKRMAAQIANEIKYKSYEDVIMEEIAQNKISHEDGIHKINAFRNSDFSSKLALYQQLHKEGALSDNDYQNAIYGMMNIPAPQKESNELPAAQNNLLDEVYGDDD